MGAAGDLEARKNANTSNVSTLTNSGNYPNSQLSAQRKNHSALYHHRRSRADQSSESEDEEESEGSSYVKGPLSSEETSPLRYSSAPEVDHHPTITPKGKKPIAVPTHGEIEKPLEALAPLACIDEGSDDDIGRPYRQTSPVTSKRSSKTSSLPLNSSRGYVSSSFFSRNRKSNLQQQLGSLPNASLQSLISSLTTSSGSSGNSTVTQKSYDRLAVRRRRSTKRRRNSKETEDKRTTRPSKSTAQTDGGKLDRKKSKPVTAAKMEEGGQMQANMSRPASTASRASRKDSILSPPTPASRRPSIQSSRSSSRAGPEIRWKRQETFNSDSGISVTSSPETKRPQRSTSDDGSAHGGASDSSDEVDSSEDESPSRLAPTARSSSATETGVLSPARALPDIDPLVQRLQEQEEAVKQHILHSPQPKRTIRPQVSSSYQPSPALPLYDQRATSAVSATYPFSPPAHAPNIPNGDRMYFQSYYDTHDSQHLRGSEPPFQLDMRRTTIAGYEMLATKLSQSACKEDLPVKPLYRKFEQLNHRVLLHLQDEIAELEEELRVLDEMIAQTSVTLPEKKVQPASRRADARYGSELHFQRTQILGRVFLKLDQYNRALTSYSAARGKFGSVLQSDVAAYRAWMDEHMPIDSAETKYLDHEHDLICPGERPEATPHGLNAADLKQLMTLQCVIMMLLLLVFSMLPGLLAKLIFGATVCCLGAATWLSQDRSIERSKKIA